MDTQVDVETSKTSVEGDEINTQGKSSRITRKIFKISKPYHRNFYCINQYTSNFKHYIV